MSDDDYGAEERVSEQFEDNDDSQNMSGEYEDSSDK